MQKDYLFNTLCRRTPLNVDDNGVLLKIEAGRKIYSHDCLQKLIVIRDRYRKLLANSNRLWLELTLPHTAETLL